jgi:energy-coupling factor transport system ATP-binding protein
VFRRRKIGFVFQEYNLVPVLNVEENIQMPVRLDGKRMDPQYLEQLLKILGLTDRRYHLPEELSGGQKRRAAIAGVLAMRPKVLVLDEPTAGLDPRGRDEILDQIAELHKKTGITVILVSHSMEDIAKYVDRIIVMNRGEKFLDGTPREVFAHYQELEEVGLAAPQVTYIMHDLRQNGLQVGNDVTTVEEAADEIMRYFRGKHPEETKL